MIKKFVLATLLLIACMGSILLSQQTYELAPYTNAQFTNSAGVPLASGSVCTYASGTTTPLVTYSNATGTANLACVSLDSSGRASIYLTSAAYKFIIKNSLGSTVRTVDPVQVAGLNAISNFNHTTNTIPKFGGSSTLTTSQITDNGTKVNIGVANNQTGTLVVAKDGTTTVAMSGASSGGEGTDLQLRYSRGNHAAPSAVHNGDNIFSLTASAYNGVTFNSIGGISISVDGTFTSGHSPPSRMGFSTNTTDATGTTQMLISSTGAIIMAHSLQIGSPTGSDKGTGTINVSGDIYKNNTAFTNPDYVFEHYYTGHINKFKLNTGASSYTGLLPLSEVESYAKSHFQLPGIGSSHGMFERSDMLLLHTEELYLHMFELQHQIDGLKEEIQQLKHSKD